MNEYSISLRWRNGVCSYEMWDFKIHTIESRQFVKEVIMSAQKEFDFESPTDLMDYICDTYEMEWRDFIYDIEINDWEI